MVLVLFTPMGETTQVIAWNYGYEVPDIAFRAADLEDRFDDLDFACEDVRTNSLYAVERIYYISRKG
jgi:hypothetical protein